MADNVTSSVGTADGAIFATDEIVGATTVHWPFTKMAFGALDTANVVTSISVNPFPVALSATDNAVLDAMVVDLAAIEVETGKSDIKVNIKKTRQSGFDRVILVATSPSAVSACRRVLDSVADDARRAVELLTWLDFS